MFDQLTKSELYLQLFGIILQISNKVKIYGNSRVYGVDVYWF